jgi:hypothetical protein
MPGSGGQQREPFLAARKTSDFISSKKKRKTSDFKPSPRLELPWVSEQDWKPKQLDLYYMTRRLLQFLIHLTIGAVVNKSPTGTSSCIRSYTLIRPNATQGRLKEQGDATRYYD